jgi:hypothetical protein
MVILNNAFNIQSFNNYFLVLTNKFKRGFVLKIISQIFHFLMKYSKFVFGFFSVFRIFLFSTNPFLEYSKSLQRVLQVLRISIFFPVDITAKSFITTSTPIVVDSENICLTGSSFLSSTKILI